MSLVEILFRGVVMYDNEFKTKEMIIKKQDKSIYLTN